MQGNQLKAKDAAVSCDPTQAVYIVTRPHLQVNKGFLRKLVVNQGYNNIVKYLARQPCEEWSIPNNRLVEWHCHYITEAVEAGST